jgi:hypothetical protein
VLPLTASAAPFPLSLLPYILRPPAPSNRAADQVYRRAMPPAFASPKPRPPVFQFPGAREDLAATLRGFPY